jgi:hypothetical protein
MIQLRDTNRKIFRLSRIRSADREFFAPRNETIAAIRFAVKFPSTHHTCIIYRKSNRAFVANPVVKYVPFLGVLSLGCHHFTGKNLDRILKWAGVEL